MKKCIKRLLNSILLLSLLVIISFSAGCSSSEKTAKEEKRVEEKTIELKPHKNVDEIEREYISASEIISIEKIQFDYDKGGKPTNREKLSKVIYDSHGLQKETIIFDKNENIDFRYVYKYEQNRRVQTLRYNSKNILDKKYCIGSAENGISVKLNKVRFFRHRTMINNKKHSGKISPPTV